MTSDEAFLFEKHLKSTDTPIGPSFLPQVQLGLTAVYTALYGSLFLFIYVQLFLILYYKHKRFSYQTVFLFLCLVWAGLRTTLFSFYFQNCRLANNFGIVWYWLLYCCPAILQFITLCLLVLYFAQVVFRIHYEADRYSRQKLLLRITIVFLILLYSAMNLSCAIIVSINQGRTMNTMIEARVIINGLLFVLVAISLAACIWKLARTSSSANALLEARGTTVCQAAIACVFIVLLYVSRAIYNLIAISPFMSMPTFGFMWINVSDQADAVDLEGLKYITFGVVLFVWEFLPTFIVVVFFRVKRPTPLTVLTSPGASPHHSYRDSRAYFFDNPRRYDSDDDLTKSVTPRDMTPINSTPADRGYGTITRSSSYPSGQFAGIPGTTPPLLFSSGNVSLSGYTVND
ncbi:G protein-coupled receptor 137Ba-like isoform X2 [Glandiceps talaboti]